MPHARPVSGIGTVSETITPAGWTGSLQSAASPTHALES